MAEKRVVKTLRGNTNRWKVPDNRHHVYSNVAGMRTTTWDISLRFGEIREDESGQPGIHEVAHVTMSPGHFKAFVMMMTSQLADYEKENGQIRLPDALEMVTRESNLGE